MLSSHPPSLAGVTSLSNSLLHPLSPLRASGVFEAITVDELPDEATDVVSEICESGVGSLGSGLSVGAKAGIGLGAIAAAGCIAAIVLVKTGAIGGGALGAAKLGGALGGAAGAGAGAGTAGAGAGTAGAGAGAEGAVSAPTTAFTPAAAANPTAAAALAPAAAGAIGAAALTVGGVVAGPAAVGAATTAGGQTLPYAVAQGSTTASTAIAAATAAGAATVVRTFIQNPVPCSYSPNVTPHPESTTFPSSNPAEAPPVDNPQDIDGPNLPDLPPTHLSIAIDTSKLGCSAEHAGGDNRQAYVSVVNKLQNVLAVLGLGSMQTSIVSFSGIAADVPAAMASEPVSDDPAVIRECIANIEPPPGADTTRASPHAAILAVNHCIHLLRKTEVRFRARRRVLVLHAGGYSGAEFQSEKTRHRDGLGWTTANCVVVSGIGKEFDRAAGVQLGCVALTCEDIEKLGNAEVLSLLKSLLAAKNPRTLSSAQ